MLTKGFLLAVTGPEYTTLAQQAAVTVAQHHPGIPIDLFTDRDIEDPVFSKIHKLEQHGSRPRFEALLRSRFERTIYLDSDLFVVAPILDVFDVLDKFDIAAAHDQRLNVDTHTLVFHTKPIPTAFPQYNAGVLGIRKSKATDSFLKNWWEIFEGSNSRIDQPILRELLYDSDLHIATLPPQYNIIDADLIRSMDSRTIAPRILHSSRVHLKRSRSGGRIQSVSDLVGPDFADHLTQWQLRDETLNKPRIKTRVEAYCDQYPGKPLHPDAMNFAGTPTQKPLLKTLLKRIVRLFR